MVRQYSNGDIDAVMQIWLDTNIRAHHFIPSDYWRTNCDMVRELLSHAEIYVHEDECAKQIDGFIGLNDDYFCKRNNAIKRDWETTAKSCKESQAYIKIKRLSEK